MSRCEFLYIEIPDQMIDRIADASIEWIEILSSIEAIDAYNIGRREYPSIRLEMFFYYLFFTRLDSDSTRDSLFYCSEK
jgi:hypothetical protein